jgi:hypothetical protein
MWPFTKQKRLQQSVKVGDILVKRDNSFSIWEFDVDEIGYTYDKNSFDTQVLSELPKVTKWIKNLDSQIEQEIIKHLDGWCDYNGLKEIITIEVSELLTENEVDISYSGSEDWADLGINIVIKNGKIHNSYAGD